MPTRLFSTALALVLLASAGPASAGNPGALHLGGEWRKMSREECARKALAALAKEKMVEGGTDAQGNAWARDEISSVLVVSLTARDGVQVFVFAAGQDGAKAAGLRDRVRAAVLDGPAVPEPDRPVEFAAEGHKPGGPVLRWGVERCNLAQTLRFFEQAASIVVEKHHFAASTPGPNVVFGQRPDCLLAAVHVPVPSEGTGYLGVLVCGAEPGEADRLQKSVRRAIRKIFFD